MKKASFAELSQQGLTAEQINNLVSLGFVQLTRDTSKFDNLADFLEKEITFLLANYPEPLTEIMGNIQVVIRNGELTFNKSNFSGLKTTIDKVYCKLPSGDVLTFDNWAGLGKFALEQYGEDNSTFMPYSRDNAVLIPNSYIVQQRAAKIPDNEILSGYKAKANKEQVKLMTAKELFKLLEFDVIGLRSNGHYCTQDLNEIPKPSWILE